MSNEAYTRHSGLLDLRMVRKQRVAVIGCGAIGKQVAMGLAGLGVGTIGLYDGDTVEIENVGPQMWDVEDVGKLKVEALGKKLAALEPNIILEEYRLEVTTDTNLGEFDADVVMCCVDSTF